MILDHLSRSEKYYTLHPNFRAAFEYLKNNDLRSLSPGKYPIKNDEIYLIINEDNPNNERRKLETHRKFIDIQTVLDGGFPLEWHDVDSCKYMAQEYDFDKDVKYYNDAPLFTVQIVSDMFAIIFPEDAHAPQPPGRDVKKAVIKVAI